MLLLSPPAQVAEAPAPLELDILGALARARAENPMLRAAKARVEERQGLITSTRADALPQLALAGDFTRLRDVSMLNSGLGENISSIFPGMSVGDLVAPRNYYTTQATLSQPLFYWGKLGTAIEVAKMGEREAGFAYTTSELDTLHGVAKAYIGVLAAQAELEVVQTRLRTAEQFLSDVKAKLEAQSATELAPPPAPEEPDASPRALVGLKHYIRAFLDDLFACHDSALASPELHAAAHLFWTREMLDPAGERADLILAHVQPHVDYMTATLKVLRPDLDAEARFLMGCSIHAQIMFFHRDLAMISMLRGKPYGPPDIEALARHITEFSLRGLGLEEAIQGA